MYEWEVEKLRQIGVLPYFKSEKGTFPKSDRKNLKCKRYVTLTTPGRGSVCVSLVLAPVDLAAEIPVAGVFPFVDDDDAPDGGGLLLGLRRARCWDNAGLIQGRKGGLARRRGGLARRKGSLARRRGGHLGAGLGRGVGGGGRQHLPTADRA